MTSFFSTTNYLTMGKEINNPNDDDLHKSSEKPDLSDIEVAIIRMICDEKTTEDIAGALNLSKRTVVSYRQKLLVKTKSRGSIGILRYAIKHGIYTDI